MSFSRKRLQLITNSSLYGSGELDTRIPASRQVVVDSLDQYAEIGELYQALEAGLMTRSDVYAELSDLAAGRRAGRALRDEITIFDSTGRALQDVAGGGCLREGLARRKGRFDPFCGLTACC